QMNAAGKKRRKRKSQAKPSGLIPLLFLLVLAVIVATGFTYLRVNRRVINRLHAPESSEIPAIYSDSMLITERLSIPATRFREMLLARRYREADTQPQNPGEFALRDGVFHIYTQQFRSAAGKVVKPARVSWNSRTSSIVNESYPGVQAFLLEPQVISYLGSVDQRASNYKQLDNIPRFLTGAVLAVEDERFFEHHGIDFLGIARAMVKNILAMRIVEGGSTITQQLAKNLLFTPRRTLGRKIMEMFAAFSLEEQLEKRQILELYLNEVYLGQEGAVAIHGVAEASRVFFGKTVQELGLGECVLLAAMIKAPSAYSPRRHLDRSWRRALLVLDKMEEQGLITSGQNVKARAVKPTIIQATLHKRAAPHYVASLTRELEPLINLEAAALSGISVYTGLDSEMQACAERSLVEGLSAAEKRHPRLQKKPGDKPLEGALVAIDPQNGKIKAWVGSRDYSENQFDHVNQASRQIGSTIKAFLYLTALDTGFADYGVATPLTILPDQPLRIALAGNKTWSPDNYDNKFRGDVTLRYALENSLNSAAVALAQRIGLKRFVSTVSKFNLADKIVAVPSLALGTADTSLLRLTAGYAALAAGGHYTAPRMWLSVLDKGSTPLLTAPIREARVADENAVYVLTNILQGAIERGTGRNVRVSGYRRDAAGKTGTSNDARDAWFQGYTPGLAAGVWLGFDDNSELGVTGGAAAAPIWAAFMQCIEPFVEDSSFERPSGVVSVEVDGVSGERATAQCPPENVTT
ncbi:MAG: PBP1A family penicillin-binding protein, partial [Prosthecobacter sp.]|nr:PBP1A family penicillin-binding protein [Prosthecobacter sp.]